MQALRKVPYLYWRMTLGCAREIVAATFPVQGPNPINVKDYGL